MITTLRIFVSLVADAFRQRRADSRRRHIRQEINEYSWQFTQEEVCARAAHQQAQDLLGPQYEQDMEEPPRLTPTELIEEFQHVATLARDMGIPFIVGVQVPGYTRIYMSSNITPAHTDTQIMCAYHDLSR